MRIGVDCFYFQGKCVYSIQGLTILWKTPKSNKANLGWKIKKLIILYKIGKCLFALLPVLSLMVKWQDAGLSTSKAWKQACDRLDVGKQFSALITDNFTWVLELLNCDWMITFPYSCDVHSTVSVQYFVKISYRPELWDVILMI